MPFNDSSNRTGLIQICEFFTGLGDATISGDSTLLKIFTTRINSAFHRLMPFLLSWSNYLKWDDENQTDLPIGTLTLNSGQADYKISQDDNSLDILNITNVRALASATATVYYDLHEMTIDDDNATEAMSPNSSSTGSPTQFLKRGNTIFLFPKPNYTVATGIKIYFEREESAFTSADTTKEAGIPLPFQELLALYASHDWLIVNKPSNTVLITRLEAQIARRERELRNAIDGRNPRRAIITTRRINFR